MTVTEREASTEPMTVDDSNNGDGPTTVAEVPNTLPDVAFTPAAAAHLQGMLRDHPQPVPGIIRAADGTGADATTLRGLHRILVTGPTNVDWQQHLRYIQTVADVIADLDGGITLPGLHRHNDHYSGDVTSIPAVRAHLTAIVEQGEAELIDYSESDALLFEGIDVEHAVNAWRDRVCEEYKASRKQ